MQKVPTKKELQQQINQEVLPDKRFYYTVTKKQRAITGSIYPKDILLIFCPEDDQLFYVNADQKLPFGDQKKLNKAQIKDIANVTRSQVNNPSGSVELCIKYPKKDQKGKQSTLQWKFDMMNKNIAQLWAQKLNNYKIERQNSKKMAENQNSRLRPNNTTSQIKRTGSYGVQAQQPKQAQKQNHIDFLLTDSKILLNKPDEFTSGVLNNYLNNSQRPQTSSNIKVNPQPTSNITITPTNNVNPSNSNISKPNTNQNNTLNVPNDTMIRNIYSSNFNSKKMNEDESRLSYAYEMTSRVVGLNQSRVQPQNQKSVADDWNFKFIKNPTREVVLEFEKAALKAFQTVYSQSRDRDESLIQADIGGFNVQLAENFTIESKRLKKQYRNYHYILQSCKQHMILNVPLACLIQHLGYVSLVKAAFPKDTQIVKNKRDIEQVIVQLQQRTKIYNSIFFNNECQFLDLTQAYGSYGESPRIYVDNLFSYLPQLNFKKKQQQLQQDNTFFVRPQLLSYLDNRLITGGSLQEQKNSKIKSQFTVALQNEILDIAECLSSEDIYITNIFDLKQFLHYRGVNMKFLFKVYQETKNKFVKKYLQTCLVAKLIKDEINYGLSIIVKQSKNIKPQQFVEEQIRLFIEGKTAATNQSWKKLTIQYRNMYGTTINTHELVGGFLLSCLMTLISAEYDITLLNKQKTIFKDQNIIERGFVISLLPKVKSYYRFSSKIVETVQICKYSQANEDVFNKLVQYMSLNSKPIPQSYNVNNGKPYILGYLSDFVLPEGMGQTLPCAKQIYSLVNHEPPSTPTLKITLNFIKQWLRQMKGQRNKGDQKLEGLMRDSIDIINYWLEFQHPKICQFYEKVAFYQQLCGDTEESLNILEKAVQIAYKTEAKNHKKIGIRHYVVGNQYLKAGRKKQAIQNLQKAKVSMQKSQDQQSEYALVLLKLSSLQLNNGDTDNCIRLAKQALKNAQKGKMSDGYIIKIFQVLCRAYQIKGEKEQLRKLGGQCSRDFNQTTQKNAFSQMVKICLTGTIAKLSLQKSKTLLALTYKIKQQEGIKDQNQSLALLMDKAKSSVVMQSFMIKSQMAQKYYNELNAKKPQSNESVDFVNTLGLVTGCVGIDFVEGLHAQKEFE